MTEDAIRRRELADLGIKAEVVSDGHTVVATFDRPQFDALVAHCPSPSARQNAADQKASDDYAEGYEDGLKGGWDNAVAVMQELVRTASPEARPA